MRFGSVEALVGMFVDPTVAGYFKNVGQQKNLLDIIQKKGELQKEATDAIAYEKETLGKAEAANTQAIADAEAHKEQAVGEAKGAALRAQVEAYTGEGSERQFRKEVAVAMESVYLLSNSVRICI